MGCRDDCLCEKAVLAANFTTETQQNSFSSFSPAFQGGAEHNVPVVISKIFKDQVGKNIFYFTTAIWIWKWVFRCSVAENVIHQVDYRNVNEIRKRHWIHYR